MSETPAVSGAVISAVRLTPTHDGEAAMVVELHYPNGGRSTVQIEGADAVAVMRRAGVSHASELLGLPWTVLRVRDVAGL
ncbi:hypothetical protein [Parahaliea aestuarii]|uniref:Uncharacterized protein n=1 Tax=Parahaliea aestuarii TaxID=1852021 RepID=A0A5C9A3T3_9GAMM|nr:hypothetical protein [Parahaliea aestuarii]TXS94739.1 hypothetical protein FVW59_02160 [Parahaliea aestuarii]